MKDTNQKFYDVINGEELTYNFSDMIDKISENPFSTDADSIFWIGEDKETTFTEREVADLAGIELESINL